MDHLFSLLNGFGWARLMLCDDDVCFKRFIACNMNGFDLMLSWRTWAHVGVLRMGRFYQLWSHLDLRLWLIDITQLDTVRLCIINHLKWKDELLYEVCKVEHGNITNPPPLTRDPDRVIDLGYACYRWDIRTNLDGQYVKWFIHMLKYAKKIFFYHALKNYLQNY